MNERDPIHVLFVCNDNAVRSPMAEVLLNRLGGGRFLAHSAGTQVEEGLTPAQHAIDALSEAGLPTTGLRRKGWTGFGAASSPPVDLVVTLCDEAAGELPPELPGQPAIAHWSQPNPLNADPAHAASAFRAALYEIRRHVELLVSLPEDRVHRLVLEAEARKLGQAREGGVSTPGPG